MLYIAMVIYNKSIHDVLSRDVTKRLIEHHGSGKAKFIIVDNSDKESFAIADDELREYVTNSGIAYIRSEKNIGLSKAYNKAIEYALRTSENPKKDFMLFVDDDSDFSYDYLRAIYLSVRDGDRDKDGVNVITGLIESGGRPMSPVEGFRFIFRSKDYITRPGTYDDICCINSGTAIRLDSLDKIGGFDESLFVDMVDYTLMYNLSRHSLNKVLVLDQSYEQTFSGRSEMSRLSALKRFKIYSKDFMRYCQIVGKPPIYGRLHLLKRRIAIDLKYKN
ncbi:MAG: glycosyltransferase [Eubacterium sp.]|nr:glycosyltransferase [Eubacterium sp.]